MRRVPLLVSLVAVALLSLVVVGRSGPVTLAQEGTPTTAGSPTAEETQTVFVRQDPALGTILTDPNGMTLYLFTKDTMPGESTCYEQCAQAWPPYTATEPLVLPRGVPGELTTISRTDGTTQVAYNGIPLYYWARDQQPGDTTGQGVGGVWFVVAPGAAFGVAASPVAFPVASPVASPAASPVAEGTVEVQLSEFTVTASATTFTVGQAYTFTATNVGGFPHEMVIEQAGAMNEPLDAEGQAAEVGPLDPGGSASVSVTFPEPGNYQITCHVRDHYPRGMALTIRVVE